MTRSYVFPFIFTSIGVSFSSAHKQEHHQPNMYGGATPAPPPTPSTQPNNLLSMSDVADALSLSRLLHRLPPNLSLPTRRSSTATSPPTISLSSQFPSILNQLHSSASQLGFFQLTDHSIPSELANSAESEALALFNSPRDQKEAYFPKSWPFGYQGNGEEDGDGLSESFCLDGSCSSESAELSLASLRELTHGLEKLGLKTIDLLCESVGFENPIGDQDPTRFCSLMWVSKGGVANGSNPVMTGGSYPFIVGLHYQIRSQKYSLLADSGWVSLLPRVDSVMVTVGDIAQVWSNGKLKKVRGRPLTIFGDEKPKDYSNSSGSITMSLLVTLPIHSTVSPLLLPNLNTISGRYDNDKDEDEDEDEELTKENEGEEAHVRIDENEGEEAYVQIDENEGEERVFNSFAFEDYAWRVYHERHLFKDPLDRHRI